MNVARQRARYFIMYVSKSLWKMPEPEPLLLCDFGTAEQAGLQFRSRIKYVRGGCVFVFICGGLFLLVAQLSSEVICIACVRVPAAEQLLGGRCPRAAAVWL